MSNPIGDMIKNMPVEAGIVQDFRIELAERIVKRLSINGISQSELARKMGVFRSVISDIVRGKKNVTISTIAKISAALSWDLLRNETISPCRAKNNVPVKTDERCVECRLDNRRYLVLPLINAEALVDELVNENRMLNTLIGSAFFAGAKKGYAHGTENNVIQAALDEWRKDMNFEGRLK